MMGSGFDTVWMSWLFWSALVVLMFAGWVLVVNWAMQGNGGTAARRPGETAMQGISERRRNAAGADSTAADDLVARSVGVSAQVPSDSNMQGEESRHGHA
ncbi:MAG TPA: hypothetical protein VGP33_05170 [Chloroflexota bacterium]|jgi:hypothetical protein|nr:hypothetical protein [Chloroflexota bacterium]